MCAGHLRESASSVPELGCDHGHPVGKPHAGPAPLAQKKFHGTGLGRLKRYALYFLAFFGIYASSSVCVFCGTPGCPVGAGAAGIIGGFFAVLWTYGRALSDRIKGFTRRFSRFRRDRHVTGPD